jgi:hypothetical protein
VSRPTATLVLLAVVAAACGASDGGPSLTTFEGDGFSVGYPVGWQSCRMPVPETDAVAAQFSGTAGGEDVSPILQVSNEGAERPFDHAVRYHTLLLELTPGYKELGNDPVEVQGAEQALRIEFTQRPPFPDPSGRLVELHGLNVLAEAADGNVVSLILSSSESQFDAMGPTFDAIVESLEVKPAGGASSLDRLPDCADTQAP